MTECEHTVIKVIRQRFASACVQSKEFTVEVIQLELDFLLIFKLRFAERSKTFMQASEDFITIEVCRKIDGLGTLQESGIDVSSDDRSVELVITHRVEWNCQ